MVAGIRKEERSRKIPTGQVKEKCAICSPGGFVQTAWIHTNRTETDGSTEQEKEYQKRPQGEKAQRERCSTLSPPNLSLGPSSLFCPPVRFQGGLNNAS